MQTVPISSGQSASGYWNSKIDTSMDARREGWIRREAHRLVEQTVAPPSVISTATTAAWTAREESKTIVYA